MTRLRLWILFLLVTSASALAYGEPTAAIQGQVLDRDGHPTANAMVRLITDYAAYLSPRNWRYVAFTDAEGRFHLSGLEPGAYVAMVSVDGKPANILQSVVLKPEESKELEFDTREDAPESAAP